MKNERVCITPTAPEKFRVYGTRKTLHGVPVVEVHSGHYTSPDFRYTATRNEDGRGWEVEDSRDRLKGDFARDRRQAIEVLAAYMAMR
jgi:hypothetical protein